MRFTPQHLERLKLDKKIVGYAEVGKRADNGRNMPQNRSNRHCPEGLEHIKQVLRRKGLIYVEEFKFITNRKFRFDLALPAFMLGLEYEGVYGGKSRHTTVTGYTKDTVKYNLAGCAGWTVLRYTASNYKDFENNLIDFLTNKSKI